MTSKLDQSLDEILDQRPPGSRRGGKRGASNTPAGGIRKRSQRAAAHKANAAITQNSSKAHGNVPIRPSGKVTASNILVSNLTFAVSETTLKDYFTMVIGSIKRCVVTYGPDGQSCGIATVEFSGSSDAAMAAQKCNGVEVDRRPMKVELVIARNAPSSNLVDRIGPPKPLLGAKTITDEPKPTTTKLALGGKSCHGGWSSGAGRPGRQMKKTAEELDADMADYVDGGNSGNTPANNAS